MEDFTKQIFKDFVIFTKKALTTLQPRQQQLQQQQWSVQYTTISK